MRVKKADAVDGTTSLGQVRGVVAIICEVIQLRDFVALVACKIHV